MNNNYKFVGMESRGLLLTGSIPYPKAIELAGQDFNFAYDCERSDKRARCALLVVQIDDLIPWGIKLFRSSYPEAVWMLDLGKQRYLAVRAQTRWNMQPMLSLFDNYNTQSGKVSLNPQGKQTRLSIKVGNSEFNAQLCQGISQEQPLISDLWTKNKRGSFYRIPWGDNKPQNCYLAPMKLQETQLAKDILGNDISWEEEAIYFTRRPHFCSPSKHETPNTN